MFVAAPKQLYGLQGGPCSFNLQGAQLFYTPVKVNS